MKIRGLLHTDLYQLAMLEAYYDAGMEEEAVFELFVRALPQGYGYLVSAGLAQVLETLEGAQFSEEEVRWVARSGHFSQEFAAHLSAFRFSGDVHAIPEGTVFFPDEPILRVTAPIPQAQLVETRVINLLQHQILVATKAARCVSVAPGRQLVDFGLRRSHGAEAGLLAARAAYLGGFAGSATVLAEPLFGVPIYGTMAHSFIEAHDDELAAFERFARARPQGLVLLIDTYDTESAARKLVDFAPRLQAQGIAIEAVRIDSGDLADHAFKVREILDAGGLSGIKIFASGGLDEHKIQDIMARRAPVDGFGVGSKLVTSAEVPYLDCAYKLVEFAGTPRRKQSEGKATWPGRKQVRRRNGPGGKMAGDRVCLEDEPGEDEPLLKPVMQKGRLARPPASLKEARRRLKTELQRLPDGLQALDAQPAYPVEISEAVRELGRQADRFTERQAAGGSPGRRFAP